METKSFFVTMRDGTEISVNRWIPEGEVKGIIHLSHGLAEHSLRYDRLGSILAENGFVFEAHDHRGHGKTAQKAVEKENGAFGFLSETDGFTKVVDDLHELILKLKEEYPGKKTFLIAHSFGSFVGQSYIENYGDTLDGCILSGTAGPRKTLVSSGKIIANIVQLLCGKKHVSKLLNQLSFGSYNKKVPNQKTEFDWLSANETNVNMYMNDKWCGFIPTAGFFADMLSGLSRIHKAKNIKQIPLALPIFLIVGKDDPVGNYSKTVEKLSQIYKKIGIKDVELKIYEGDRHELYNDNHKETVESDTVSWLNAHC